MQKKLKHLFLCENSLTQVLLCKMPNEMGSQRFSSVSIEIISPRIETGFWKACLLFETSFYIGPQRRQTLQGHTWMQLLVININHSYEDNYNYREFLTLVSQWQWKKKHTKKRTITLPILLPSLSSAFEFSTLCTWSVQFNEWIARMEKNEYSKNAFSNFIKCNYTFHTFIETLSFVYESPILP